jgi:hypothetical protein
VTRIAGTLILWLPLALSAPARGQPPATAERPVLVLREDFETDAERDGEPDGWYNRRDAEFAQDGKVGPACLKFHAERPGRPARISRGFAVDGKSVEALRVGLWVKAEDILPGERLGEAAGLMIDLLGDDVRSVGRRNLGPWTAKDLGEGWVHVARRLPVPPGARDGILTVGLLGGTGALWIDGLTIEAEPRGGATTSNLLLNGDLELGDPEPAHWTVEGGARRAEPGRDSDAALELTAAGAKATTGIAVPARRFGPHLVVRLAARGTGLRGAGGAVAGLIFLDEQGRTVPGTAAPPFRFAGSFDWRTFQVPIEVPRGATSAVLQVEKTAAGGSIRIDQVEVQASPDPGFAAWTPYHEADETDSWRPYEPAASVTAGSALDASSLLDAPAGKHGRVVVRQGHLAFEKGGRARFFGVALLPPTAFLEPDRADALAENLARRGVNLVRLADLDTPLGPGLSLLDDARDDTRALDPVALARLDHLIAALKARGIYVALEILGQRRFRAGDEVKEPRRLKPGGGPAAAFDPAIRQRATETAQALLEHVNPETKLALRDDPVLAWVALAGEHSLFDLIDEPEALGSERAEALKERVQRTSLGTGRRAWQAIEAEQWAAGADALRGLGLKAPIAGSSHWRREPEFAAAQVAPGLDLVDDRLYWRPPPWGPPGLRSLAWDVAGFAAPAAKKRRADRPYIVGEWASHTGGAWALPYEAADLVAATRTAVAEDWDALVRRGVYRFPAEWGAAAPGTGGGSDVFPIPEVVNAVPPLFALLPHAASLMLRRDEAAHRPRPAAARGRLAIDTPHTVVLGTWAGDRLAATEGVGLEIPAGFAVVAVSALGTEPLSRASRLLVTAVGRAQPTGLAWADTFRREVADPGRPPILLEPVRATVTWKRRGPVTAYALDESGKRLEPVAAERTGDGVRVELGKRAAATLHWELVAE